MKRLASVLIVLSALAPLSFGQVPDSLSFQGFLTDSGGNPIEVKAGDFLLPSGLGDGTAVGLSPTEIDANQLPLVFATAWESTEGLDRTSISAAVGIDQTAAAAKFIAALRDRQDRLEAGMDSLRSELVAIRSVIIN